MAVTLLAGCGPHAATSVSSAHVPAKPSDGSNSAPSSSSSSYKGSAGGTSAQANPGGPPYLIKSLQVSLQVKDTRATAGAILAWIEATDSKSTTMGQQYSDDGDGLYTVTLQISVQATLYPQIEQYLLDYPAPHGGKLLNLQESVQDVTNSYVDNQARIANLETERQRLLDLLGKASNLSDILALDQQLTTVEGELEQIKAQQQTLASEVTFYTVTLTLTPAELPAPAPSTHKGFNFGGTLRSAWNAALVFAGWLAVVGIWLAIFSVFTIPALAVVLLVRGIRRRRSASMPPLSSPAPSA
jgi:hypothetical protein